MRFLLDCDLCNLLNIFSLRVQYFPGGGGDDLTKVFYWGGGFDRGRFVYDSNKGGVSYDSLVICQWVSGFAMRAREETNMDRKNAMLESLGELMEDSNDFSWQYTKAADFINVVCVRIKGITRQGGYFLNIYMPLVSPWPRDTDTGPKIVGHPTSSPKASKTLP